jgi:hypothetical protein
LLVGCGGATSTTAPAELGTPADRTGIEAAAPLDLAAVIAEFRANEKNARAGWEGKWVTVTGALEAVYDGNLVLDVKGVAVVNCLYPRTNAERQRVKELLAQGRPGGPDGPLTATGRLMYDLGMNGVYLKDCVFSVPVR